MTETAIENKDAIIRDLFITPDSYREQIFLNLDELVSDFLYYDRREDEDLPLGKIEEMVAAPWVTIGEMAAFFEARLRERIPGGIIEGVVVEQGNPDIPPAE